MVGSKRKKFFIKNSIFRNFSFLYIIGVVYGALTGVKIPYDKLSDVKSGFDAVLKAEYLSPFISQSLYGWMITLVLWSLGILCALNNITSYLIYLISAFVGISAGMSCTTMIYLYKTQGIVYSLSYIIPVCVVRFFLWYIFLKVSYMIRYNADNINRRHNISRGKRLLFVLVIMMIWDMVSAAIGVVFSHIIF